MNIFLYSVSTFAQQTMKAIIYINTNQNENLLTLIYDYYPDESADSRIQNLQSIWNDEIKQKLFGNIEPEIAVVSQKNTYDEYIWQFIEIFWFENAKGQQQKKRITALLEDYAVFQEHFSQGQFLDWSYNQFSRLEKRSDAMLEAEYIKGAQAGILDLAKPNTPKRDIFLPFKYTFVGNALNTGAMGVFYYKYRNDVYVWARLP